MIRPKQLLKDIGRNFPNAWKDVKSIRADKGSRLPNWADYCYLPIAAGVAIVTGGDNSKIYEATISQLSPAIITAAAAWRVSQGVYRFDADLYNSLTKQDMDGNIPYEILTRLPEWCVYIETMNATFMGMKIEGFLAHLEHDANDGRMELRLVLMVENGLALPLPVHIGQWSVSDGLDKMQDVAGLPKINFTDDVVPLLQLVLYLCAENADMPKPTHPRTRIRMSGGIDAPKEPRIWHVGERIGASIRTYRNTEGENLGGTHASPRPHVRKAHWHHFRVGKDKQDLILKWLPPIPVMVGEDEHPVVIHEVQK